MDQRCVRLGFMRLWCFRVPRRDSDKQALTRPVTKLPFTRAREVVNVIQKAHRALSFWNKYNRTHINKWNWLRGGRRIDSGCEPDVDHGKIDIGGQWWLGGLGGLLGSGNADA